MVFGPCIVAMNLIINKSILFLYQYLSVILGKYSSKLEAYTESLSILSHLKYALVCSLYARLFIARMDFFWRTKILEVLF